MRRFIPLVAALVVAATCLCLGIWQLGRLRERRAANAQVLAAMSQPAVMLPGEVPGGPGRRATASGRFDFERQIIVESRSFEGTPAIVVVTPLVLPDSVAILVERGWVRSPDGPRLPLDQFRETDTATVTGVLVATPAPAGGDRMSGSPEWPLRVRWADPRALSGFFPYRLLPLVLRREGNGVLRAVPPPEISTGPHLSYAIQWFSFAVIAVVVGTVLFIRERRSLT